MFTPGIVTKMLSRFVSH